MSAKSKGFVIGLVVGFAANHILMKNMSSGS